MLPWRLRLCPRSDKSGGNCPLLLLLLPTPPLPPVPLGATGSQLLVPLPLLLEGAAGVPGKPMTAPYPAGIGYAYPCGAPYVACDRYPEATIGAVIGTGMDAYDVYGAYGAYPLVLATAAGRMYPLALGGSQDTLIGAAGTPLLAAIGPREEEEPAPELDGGAQKAPQPLALLLLPVPFASAAILVLALALAVARASLLAVEAAAVVPAVLEVSGGTAHLASTSALPVSAPKSTNISIL
jgi:hypothetical protein